MKVTYVRHANYHETDQMGVIHHANYVKWMEEARIEFMKEIGLSYKKMESFGVVSPVMGISVEYKKPVHFDDDVVIIPQIKEYTGLKVVFTYQFFVGNVLCATAESKHCFLREESPVSLKKDYPVYHDVIMKAMEK